MENIPEQEIIRLFGRTGELNGSLSDGYDSTIKTLLQSGLAYGVCRIQTPKFTGSGFHYGNGWIMTNAHVLTNTEDVSQARFEFTTSSGQNIVYGPAPHFALRYRM